MLKTINPVLVEQYGLSEERIEKVYRWLNTCIKSCDKNTLPPPIYGYHPENVRQYITGRECESWSEELKEGYAQAVVRIADTTFPEPAAPAVEINTILPKGFFDTIPYLSKKHGNQYCMADKKYRDYTVDDFVEYVKGQLTARDDENGTVLCEDELALRLIFPAGSVPHFTKNDNWLGIDLKTGITTFFPAVKGSGLNGDENFKKYGTWHSALYDVWEQIKKDNHI